MNEFEQQPDEFWRKAFDEAAETPPPRVWDAIERRLDESEGPRVLPIWGTGLSATRPLWGTALRWGAGLAAAVALLLVGWWAVRNQTVRDPDTSVAHRTVPQRNRAAPDTRSAAAPTVLADRTDRPADAQLKPNADAPTLAINKVRPTHSRRLDVNKPAGFTERTQSTPTESLAQSDVQVPTGLSERRMELITLPDLVNQSVPKTAEVMPAATAAGQPTAPLTTATPSAIRSVDNVAFTPVPSGAAADPVTSPTSAVGGQPASSPAVLRESAKSVSTNDVFSAEPEAVQPQRKSREVWASVSAMPGAFDPAVTIRTAVTQTLASASVTNYAVSPQVAVTSRANFSVAYQAVAGVQLTEHWSVESGVGYLSGRSTVYSPTQPWSSATSAAYDQNAFITADPLKTANVTVGNLYVDILRSQLENAPATRAMATVDGLLNNGSLASQQYSGQAQQAVTNDYRYVQVPVQVGYQLRPRKRLGLALLGGLLTNIFVRNTVADELVITSRDGVYRPLSWAASLGARFRYRPSRRWSASLAGLYQPSLGLGTRPESVVRSQPTSVGMSFGLDYHF